MGIAPRTPAARVLTLADGRAPVAFLIAISEPERSIAFPIPAGYDLVGWRRQRSAHRERLAEADRCFESVQWILDTDGVTASVEDAASTDGSFLFRAVRPPPPGKLSLLGIGALPGAQELPHPSRLGGRRPPPTPLYDGDYLVTFWATLRFELVGR